ncbi:probable 39S ribosomal protein L49, mitochondrial [Sitodiplosis mosellana]|uniref:probable 39S ribosomal protein L49, mitochondrial n=1 Tax=Sitodiplosis mosellana TaxID=263140 RepID=UPI002444A70B|nr:probable 39S ribosomal protein L49, mitochondrial [Sitodiplosis mosellana]
MAFFVRNTHRTFSAIFKKTLANSTAKFSACNGINSSARALHTSRVCFSENSKLTATDEVDLNAQPLIEILKNPPEWKYVERILPKSTVPSVQPKEQYSSGWTPQKPDALKQPYFIKRTKNHMVPVYLQIDYRGTRRRTFIKHISGDIWKLHNELMDYIEYYMAKKERSRVNEFSGQIIINGDYVNLLKDYLVSKGF